MRVTLTDGRMFRVGFRHIDVDDLERQYIATTGKDSEKANQTFTTFADALAFTQERQKANGISEELWVTGLTQCFITEVTGAPITRDPDPLGEAFKSHVDKFDKEKGRKLSLTRALDTLFPYDRDIRGQFWKAYLER